MKHLKIPIVVKQSFDKPVFAVWRAITQHSEMVQWYFENIKDFIPKVGFKTEFTVQSGGRNFLHRWEILEVVANKKISYTWTYPDFPGYGKVTFDLSENEEKTLLTLTAEGMETFPQDIPEFTRKSCTAGWEYFIQNRLKAYLDKS